MRYKKIFLVIFITIISIPAVTMAGSVTFSLMQGKTTSEAFEILANQIDSIFNRVSVLEEDFIELEITNQELSEVTTSQADQISQLEAENQALRQQFEERDSAVQEQLSNQAEEQERLRALDKYCQELSQAGSKYFPTKQHIEPLYNALLRQASVPFEDAYNEYLDGERKPKTVEEYRKEWEIRNEMMGGNQSFEKDYAAYLEHFPKPQTKADFRITWTQEQTQRESNIQKIRGYYEEYMQKCR